MNIGRRVAITMVLAGALLGAVMTTPPAWAVPARPGTVALAQPDGRLFDARLRGNEQSHGWETAEGYAIVQDGAGWWVYAVKDTDGALIPSGALVGVTPPPTGLRPGLRAETVRRAITQKRRAETAAAGLVTQTVPPTGTANVPVLLVNFAEPPPSQPSTTATQVNSRLFGTGTGSMKDYFEEVSYGAFSVAAGPSGVVDWYTAANNHDYYGANTTGGHDVLPGELVEEAVINADATVDFSAYDNDGDCYVDLLFVVHQGTGEENAVSGTAADLWSGRSTLSDDNLFGYGSNGVYTTDDTCGAGGNIKIDAYALEPELLDDGVIHTVGAYVHDFAHALGLPDLDDGDGSSAGAGGWSLMAAGAWNQVERAGDSPAHLDPWSKSYLGWVTPTGVTTTLTNETVSSAHASADVYQLGTGTPLSGEYFLVENRQQSGFDAGLPGAGLLIWHIDGGVIANLMDQRTVNNFECYPGSTPACSTQHYGVGLVQADGLWELEKNLDTGDAGDPYASGGNDAFSAGTTPSSDFHTTAPSYLSVTNVSAPGTDMTADFVVSGPAATPLGIFTEDFAGGIPGTWTRTSGTTCPQGFDPNTYPWTDTNPGGWSFGTPFAGTFAIADSDQTGGNGCVLDESLVTPDYDLTACAEVRLEFSNAFREYNQLDDVADIADVDVSTDGGGSWTNALSMTSDDGHPAPNTKSLDLTALVSRERTVRIRWRYHEADWQWYWAIDNVELSCAPVDSLCQGHLPVAINGGFEYELVQGAVADAQAGVLIKLRDNFSIAGDVNVDLAVPGEVTFQGGWNCALDNRTGTFGTINGVVTIKKGAVIFDGVEIE